MQGLGLTHDELARHIRTLIDYNWKDELRDYEADENDSRDAHIFNTLVALDNHVQGTNYTPESYLIKTFLVPVGGLDVIPGDVVDAEYDEVEDND